MSDKNEETQDTEHTASDAQTLFPDVILHTAAGDVTIRPLSFARLLSLTPVLENLVLRMKVEGLVVDPTDFHPSFEELTKMYLVTAPVALELMTSITGQSDEFFDKISVREGAQIFVACVKVCWSEIAPFFGLFTQPKHVDEPAPQS